MGFLSSIQKYHSADERPNENNTAEFGTPARTLFTELDPGDLHQKTEVLYLYYYWLETPNRIYALQLKEGDIYEEQT